MEDKVFKLAYELYDLLMASNEYKELKKIEKEMLENKLSKSLINNYQSLEEKYASDKNEEVLKKLHKAKLEMDINPLVITYKIAYKKYQMLISNITDIVFKDFKDDTTIEKIFKGVIK